jgi:hypothetical protein
MKTVTVGALMLVLLGVAVEPAVAQGGRLAFTSENDLFTMRADGSERALVATGDEHTAAQPDVSPDGQLIAYGRSTVRTAGIAVVGIDGKGVRWLTKPRGGAGDRSPAWSPDGTRIAFVRSKYTEDRLTSSIVVIDLASRRQQRLVHTVSRCCEVDLPAWSPDGTRLLYTRYRYSRTKERAAALYILDLTTRKSTRLPGEADFGTWSPDGSRIAFSSTRDRNGEDCFEETCSPRSELYVMGSDGSGATRLTDSVGDDDKPDWSSDGSSIAFRSSRNSPTGGEPEIYSIRPDGSCLTWLTNGIEYVDDPDWQRGAGVPQALGCGARSLEPTAAATPKGVHGYWLGSIGAGNTLLQNTIDSYVFYGDCALFDPAECLRPIQLQTDPACNGGPIDPFDGGDLEIRRGALVQRSRSTAGTVVVYTGSDFVTIDPDDDTATAQVDAAIDALRPLPSADPVTALSKPRFHPLIVLQIESARKLRTVSRVARGLGVSRRQARRILAFAKAVEPLGDLKAARCAGGAGPLVTPPPPIV